MVFLQNEDQVLLNYWPNFFFEDIYQHQAIGESFLEKISSVVYKLKRLSDYRKFPKMAKAQMTLNFCVSKTLS